MPRAAAARRAGRAANMLPGVWTLGGVWAAPGWRRRRRRLALLRGCRTCVADLLAGRKRKVPGVHLVVLLCPRRRRRRAARPGCAPRALLAARRRARGAVADKLVDQAGVGRPADDKLALLRGVRVCRSSNGDVDVGWGGVCVFKVYFAAPPCHRIRSIRLKRVTSTLHLSLPAQTQDAPARGAARPRFALSSARPPPTVAGQSASDPE